VPTAVTTALSLLALVLAVGAIVLATLANRRWATRSRTHGVPPGPEGPIAQAAAESSAAVAPERSASPLPSPQVEALAAAVESLEGAVAELRRQVDEAAGAPHVPQDPTALRHVALVRYDAFADVGGRLSYSLAVLDDTRSGLVLTTLAGKTDVRTYVRAISAGEAEGTLTAEEHQAIEAAGRRA
jgi:hypothetical protein